MANTYTLISSNVLSSSAASVTFSAIPSTYTDLVVRFSARNSAAGTIGDCWVRFNAATTNYSDTEIYGTGSAAGSGRSASSWLWMGDITAAGNTANSFASSELYIPNYAGANNKVASAFTALETNATAARINAVAQLWSNTAAITSIGFFPNTTNFDAGSSFYLYGIKNS